MRWQDVLSTYQRIAASIATMNDPKNTKSIDYWQTYGDEEIEHTVDDVLAEVVEDIIEELRDEINTVLENHQAATHPHDGACIGIWLDELLDI